MCSGACGGGAWDGGVVRQHSDDGVCAAPE